ncbi:MAG: DinB family protein [Chlorobiaceae bacterium]|nr:DinB family protein [Chlorobiaceae bacterium]
MSHPFCQSASAHLGTVTARLLTCLDTIGEERLWVDFAPNLASPGNLVLHLIGNLSQYVLKTLGNHLYYRERSKEFAGKPEADREALKKMLIQTVSECQAVIDTLDENALCRSYVVQGLRRSGYEILLLVIEHFGYHTGQFAWFSKYLFEGDFDFFRGRNLDIQ